MIFFKKYKKIFCLDMRWVAGRKSMPFLGGMTGIRFIFHKKCIALKFSFLIYAAIPRKRGKSGGRLSCKVYIVPHGYKVVFFLCHENCTKYCLFL